MAVITSVAEIAGTKNLPSPNEIGKVYEYDVVVDTSVSTVASGDFLQLCEIPPESVITALTIISDTTTTATFNVGIADAAATTAITSLFNPGTLTADTSEASLIWGDAKVQTARILAAQVGTAGENTAVITVRVQYRAG